jgi:hypothetical protein
MPAPQRKVLARHRRNLKRRGIVRLEVRVGAQDAPLMRDVAQALADPVRQAEARAVLRAHFAGRPAVNLKDLLASAPLDGIDLERSREPGRDVDL